MRLFVSEAGVRLPDSTVRWVSCGVSLVLAVTLLTGPPTAAVATEADAAASGEAAPVKSRPDVVSAAITARAQGKRVEVEGLRTETDTTFANPDGTMTTEAHAGAIRYQDEKDAWHKIDLDLGEDQAGTVSPEATGTDLTLAGGQKDASGKDGIDLARVVEPLDGDREAVVAMQAPGALSTPVLEANTATYEDVTPDADLFVRTTQEGFEQQLVLNSSAALQEYASEDGTVAWRIPVRTAGVTPRAEDDGSVSFVAADGTVVSHVVAPLAWDAQVDEKSGDPVSRAEVALSVEDTDNGSVLVVTPDQEWVKDADRQFPVTIDPSYAKGSFEVSADTYVSKQNPSTNFGSDPELRVGTYNGGTEVARSFLNIPITSVQGRDITSAQLRMYETHSYSCTAREFFVRAAETASGSTTWNNQPAASTQLYGSTNVAKGFSSACAAGWVGVDITSLARVWADKPSNIDRGGIRLTASESDSYGWKKFASLNHSSGRAPYVSFTYNRAPGTPSAATVDSKSAASYAPPGGSAETFTNTLTPTVSVKATDPDASRVKTTVQFHSSTAGTSSSLIDDCTTALVGSGSAATCKPGASLGLRKVYVRSKAVDERGLGGSWSGWTSFTTTSAAPPVPAISCPDPYAQGSWAEQAPSADITCTITAADGTLNQAGYIDLTVDGSNKRVKITPSSSAETAKTTVTISKAKTGYHSIEAAAVGRGSRVSANATHSFGWGGASLTTPTDRTATSSKIRIEAGSAPRNTAGSVSAKVRWRPKNSGGAWEDGPSLSTNSSAPASDPVVASGTWNPAEATTYGGTELPTRTPVTYEIQVCFTYAGSSSPRCTGGQSPTTVTRLPHAFGDDYPTTSAGTGDLALLTGELSSSDTDASVPGFSSDLTISRSHLSFTGSGAVADWPGDPATSIFGPGFTANLDGPEAGASTMQVVDNTRLDGTIVLQYADGGVLVYGTPSEQPTYATGTWEPVTEDTAAEGSRLTLSGSGSTMSLSLKDEIGTVTTWSPVTYSSSARTVWKPVAVTETGESSASTFSYEGSSGRVTSITAGVPGADCSPAASVGAQKGCRALVLTYGGSNSGTDSTPGDRMGQVKQISTRLWNPATSALETTPMTSYAYDGSGRLRTVTDERTGLSTGYTWVGAGASATSRIATVKPAGLAAWKYSYDSDGRLTRVERGNPAGSGADVTLGRYVYEVPVSAPGLPALSSLDTVVWGQASAPSNGFAVFGPDYTGPVSGSDIDWTYADLQYVDAEGYTVNTAAYGAGAWQVAANDYDPQSNLVRELAPSAINAVRRAAEDGADLDTTRGLAETLSTRTVYNDEITDSEGRVVMPAGTVVTDVYAPARASITKDGSAVTAREHTRTTYDEGAPNGGINPATGQRYALPTKVTVGAALSGGGDEENDLEVISVTEMGYARSQSADGDGWVLGTATSRTVAGATAVNRYDGQGRLIEYRQPLSNGTDAGATSISYYTAGSNSANSACANKPEWAGLECQVGPKADAVATGASAGGGGSLPSTTTTYTKWLDVAETIETSASSTRTNTTAYDSAGREFKSTITASISGSTAVPGTFTKYQSSTGLIDYTGKLNAAGNDATEDRTVYTYDSWGREIRRINDLGDEISTAYDTSSRPIEVTDPRGTTTTTYNSGAERRGVPTSMSVSRASDAAGSLKFTADYDADGNMVTQELPGGITQTNLFDATGNQVGITYAGQLTSSSGEVTTGPWIGFSQDRDVSGRVRFDYTTEGAAAAEDADTANIGQSGTFNRAYSYDASGRLARVDDQSAAAGSEAASAPTACTRRDYTFDANGRRTSLKSGVSTDGTCASGTASISYAYDSADRPTTGRNGAGAYVYDAFGRQTTIPAVDAPNAANAEITLGYFDTDAVRSISQDGRQTSYTLDTDGRRSTQTVTSGSVTSKVTMHYSDDSDNPSWTQLVNGSTSSITRYEASLSGKLGVSISQTKSLVSLLNLHGDVAAIVPVGNNQASSSASTSLEDWSTYDEYGERIASSVPSNAQTRGYGWLGSKQRFTSDETMGLTLMGARLYNPSRGLFTSVDPLPGGTESAYAYPADPVNETDISGLAQDPGGTRIKCKCTKENRNWSAFPIRTVLGKWGKWSNVPYTSRVPRFIKRLLDDWFDNVIGARVTKRQIRHKTNTVVFWRCRKGYKQYKTVRTTVGQYRWRVKFKVLFTSKSLWFSGSGSVTGRRTTYSS